MEACSLTNPPTPSFRGAARYATEWIAPNSNRYPFRFVTNELGRTRLPGGEFHRDQERVPHRCHHGSTRWWFFEPSHEADEASKTNATYSIPFPVLSDSDLSMIEGFHVAMHVDDAQLAKLKSFGVDLEQYSGKGHHTIAIPSLFLIDKKGVVRWAHSDPTYTQRPSTSQILAAIDGVRL
jgi:hypothetical protein